MYKSLVSLGFTKLADANLVIKTNQIITGMTGNGSYPNPVPAILAVQNAATTFADALTAAADGGRIKTAQKNAAREALLALLGNLALYVQQTCTDDLAVLLSSGFEARKVPQPAGTLPAPVGTTLLLGALSGVLDLRSKPVVNARSYEAQMTTDVNKEESWKDVGTFTSTRIALEDLTPGMTYWARVRAIGSWGPGAWSDPVSAMAV